MFESDEVWGDIPGYEGFYQASNLGQIRSLPRQEKRPNGKSRFRPGRLLKGKLSRNHYWSVNLCKDGTSRWTEVHRLVAMVFLPDFSKEMIVHHVDHNRQNNRVSNLAMMYWSEHTRYHVRLGQKNKSIRRNPHVLTVAQVKEIRELIASHVTKSKIAEMFNVNNATIGRIANGHTWKRIP